MPVVDSWTDASALTQGFVSVLGAPPALVWQLWADPRRLERWWGPPLWPATFDLVELLPGAMVRYFVSGVDGARIHAWWRITLATAPCRLEFDDGTAGSDESLHLAVSISADGSGSRMTVVTTYPGDVRYEVDVECGGAQESMLSSAAQLDGALG